MIHRAELLKDIHIADYDYCLPDERIARYPLSERDQSKLLVYKDGSIGQTEFSKLPEIIGTDQLLVFNNTQVIPARLKFQNSTGANIEIFCLEPINPSDYQESFQSRQCTWKCMVGNLKKWKDRSLTKTIDVNGNQVILIAEKINNYITHQHIRFSWNNDTLSFSEVIEFAGVTPIPPYLKRDTELIDHDRYQTIYSHVKGSVAAPTAGLHFTESLLKRLQDNSISLTELTLHVGAGTFKPVQTDKLTDHEMHAEFFSITEESLQNLIDNYGKIVCVGTTSLRTLESLYWLGIKVDQGLLHGENIPHLNQWDAYELDGKISYPEAIGALLTSMKNKKMDKFYGTTQIMIAPGYRIRSIKALVTNFHQPKSTLLLLVSAITGNDWKRIYQYALDNDFRFLSYGDGSIIFC